MIQYFPILKPSFNSLQLFRPNMPISDASDDFTIDSSNGVHAIWVLANVFISQGVKRQK